ncbi:MAG: DUF7660 family protein [Bacteroidota bacterium]
MELHEMLEQVNSKETFLTFVVALMKDKLDEEKKESISPSSPYSEGANGWQNITIPSFLEAAHAYTIDSKKIELIWYSFAMFLYAGKIYE